jgi:hypothetical protein
MHAHRRCRVRRGNAGRQVLTRTLEQRDETCWSQPLLKERRGTTGEQTTKAEKGKEQESDDARMRAFRRPRAGRSAGHRRNRKLVIGSRNGRQLGPLLVRAAMCCVAGRSPLGRRWALHDVRLPNRTE